MVLDKRGQEFFYKGKRYYIGQQIMGTNASEYEGLFGVITEIRDGEDKDTENETPDIYCSFSAPKMPCDIEKLETRFSKLYGEPKKVEDLALDLVVMAPEMIEPLKTVCQTQTVFLVFEKWVHKNNWGTHYWITTSMKEARKQMRLIFKEELENGFWSSWLDGVGYIVESSDTCFEIYEDGYAEAEHYLLYIVEHEMSIDPLFAEMIATLHRERSYERDLCEYSEKMLEDGEITKEQYDQLSVFGCCGEDIARALSKNDAYWNAYWQTISNKIHEHYHNDEN